jgi:hypothetical protein
MDDDQLIYPVDRLLANPRIFYAIANFLGGPDGEILKEAFYELIEYHFNEYEDVTECAFEATEVCFRMDGDTEDCEIILDSGLTSVLQAVEGEVKPRITTDGEMAATSAIYKRLVTAIEQAHPELEGNIALCSPPTPGNAYLRSPDGDNFQGNFHLLTDPERLYAFHVEVIDVQKDQLKATIKPI